MVDDPRLVICSSHTRSSGVHANVLGAASFCRVAVDHPVRVDRG